MSFGKFVVYLVTRQNGEIAEDQAYKHYDLLRWNGPSRLRKALRMAGFKYAEVSVSLAECSARIRDWGHNAPGNEALQQYLCEWYVYQRIVDGECKQWPYRVKSNTRQNAVAIAVGPERTFSDCR